MKQCPYCGAQLQEQARFCLYCMRSLENKPDVTPRPIPKKWPWLLLATAAVVVVAILLLCLPRADQPQRDTTVASSPQTTVASAPSTQEEGPKQPICSIVDFQTAISYNDPLWDPYWAMSVGSIGQWERCYVPFHIADARLDLYFYRGGERVCASLSAVPESDLEKAAGVADGVIDIVCQMYEKGREKAHIRGGRLTAAESVDAEASLIVTAAPADPLGTQTDTGTEWVVTSIAQELAPEWRGYPKLTVTCELRRRVWEGAVFYDIFLFVDQP